MHRHRENMQTPHRKVGSTLNPLDSDGDSANSTTGPLLVKISLHLLFVVLVVF